MTENCINVHIAWCKSFLSQRYISHQNTVFFINVKITMIFFYQSDLALPHHSNKYLMILVFSILLYVVMFLWTTPLDMVLCFCGLHHWICCYIFVGYTIGYGVLFLWAIPLDMVLYFCGLYHWIWCSIFVGYTIGYGVL